MKVSRRGLRLVGAIVASVIAGCLLTGPGWAATPHLFSGTYAGSGTGNASGTSASGRATMTGRGRLIGASTLSGSGSGTFTSSACVVFNGSAVLRGRSGSIRLAARNAQACAATADASQVSFSGTANVVRGTSAFAGARGRLSFSGTYTRATNRVTIRLSGRITY